MTNPSVATMLARCLSSPPPYTYTPAITASWTTSGIIAASGYEQFHTHLPPPVRSNCR